ncbi:MAG: trypsin-like peptidase domain-containing protein [Thermoflexibacteraceae bacterium]
MNTTVKSVIISLFAGFAGAGLYHGLVQTSTSDNTLFTHYESQENNGNFANSQFANFNRNSINNNIDFVQAAMASTPCVVYIKTVSQGQQQYSWFDWFFGGQQNNRVLGSGSGVIFSKDGYIMTNNHVINNADKIEVVHNKRTYQAQIVGTDPSTDLALLKVESNGLPAIKLASSSTVNVGDWVLAVGNPFNLTSTVTAGIVSAKGRDIGILKSQFPLESFIQTDAAINPGNSGGALVNLRGDLVGINTAILSQTGSYSGYGFAVPADIVAKVYNDLKQYGQVQKAFIGVDVIDVDESVAKEKNLSEITGVFVTYMEEEGAANNSGIKKGDIILKINGKAITSKSNFDEQISYYRPGDKITLQVNREGKILEKSVQLTNIDGTTSVTKKTVFYAESIGAELENVHRAEKSRLNIESGVRIVKIKNGLVARLGIEEGFIITHINNVLIESPEKLTNILENIQGRVVIKGVNKLGNVSVYSYYF